MLSKVYLYIDGASKGNPGPAAVGIVIKDCKGNMLREYKEYIGIATNNIAEYIALQKGIELASEHSKNIIVVSDSLLLTNQMNKKYKIKAKHLKELSSKIYSIIARRHLNIKYIFTLRDENVEADRLANEAIRQHSSIGK